jgi:hypothetical protein
MSLMSLLTAQSVPPTVAQPPRMPFTLLVSVLAIRSEVFCSCVEV